MSEEELLLKRIKVIGDGEFTLLGTPDELIKEFHSYTQERELEARINEIDYLNNNFQEDAQDWMRDHPGYTTLMIPMEDYVKRRDELIAQLNKSKGESE